ncbi:hypothetical protein MKZ38_005969 [Zalerion maritima]|uniref:DUF7918 domain-containing protein n=1 Tax=Zalerion maritima TaxID=339359 RepID=A0AAD5WW12_9PEZI|nr:hypothetical protein MKZ38_005969 [Zalerion maritima]
MVYLSPKGRRNGLEVTIDVQDDGGQMVPAPEAEVRPGSLKAYQQPKRAGQIVDRFIQSQSGKKYTVRCSHATLKTLRPGCYVRQAVFVDGVWAASYITPANHKSQKTFCGADRQVPGSTGKEMTQLFEFETPQARECTTLEQLQEDKATAAYAGVIEVQVSLCGNKREAVPPNLLPEIRNTLSPLNRDVVEERGLTHTTRLNNPSEYHPAPPRYDTQIVEHLYSVNFHYRSHKELESLGVELTQIAAPVPKPQKGKFRRALSSVNPLKCFSKA